MSILPSRNSLDSKASSSSSSSSAQHSSQVTNHGVILPHEQEQENQQLHLLPPIHSFGSLQISSDSSSSVPNNFAGSVDPATVHIGGSCQSVSGSRRQNGNTTDHRNSGKRTSQSESADQAAAVSAQRMGKTSGATAPSRNYDKFSSGSTGSQGNATHSGGRKAQMVSGNHLLNFQYDPISRSQPRIPPPPPRRQQRRRPYNKDLFLQANYKFVVLDSGNYAPEAMDPDKMLQWEDIICVKYSTPSPVQCPICLGDPLCPQITSCGHIFCFPCIMQYFSMDEDNHKGEIRKKCPLCFMMLSSKDLYTIYLETVKQHCVGDFVEFMLLTRRKDSFALTLKDNEGVGSSELPQDSFSKFTFTSDVELSVREAMSDLDSWLARADSGLVDDLEKLPYVCAAMEQLEQRKKYWNEHRITNGNKAHISIPFVASAHGSPPTGRLNDPDRRSRGKGLESPEKSAPDDKEFCGAQTADIESSEEGDGSISSSYDDNKSMQGYLDGFNEKKERDSYNFYQAVDGQHLILHPLNMKCLLHHYGSYDRLPNRISGRILQLETVTQSEAIRRRYRYLSHFSLTTTFQLCEIDISEMLPVDSLSPFMDEIKNREKQRKRLARKERQEKIKAEAACTPLTPIPFELARSYYDGPPTFSMDDFEALGSSVATSSSPPTIGERQSFSNVARLGFAAGYDSPLLKPNEPQNHPKDDVAHDSSRITAVRNAGMPSFANVASRAKPAEGTDSISKTSEAGKKGKKPSRVLLSTAGGRRY